MTEFDFEDAPSEWEQEHPDSSSTPDEPRGFDRNEWIGKRSVQLQSQGVSAFAALTRACEDMADLEAKINRQEREARNRAAQADDAPTDRRSWNQRISESASDSIERWELRDFDPGTDQKQRAGLTVSATNEHAVDLLGSEGNEDDDNRVALLIDEPPPTGEGSGNRQATGRKRASADAVKVTRPDGTADLDFIGNDVAAMVEALGGKDYSRAFARRRSETANDLRAEATQLMVGFLDRKATRKAIAEAFGVTPQTVRTCLKDAGR